MNLCIRVACAMASDSGVLTDGVGMLIKSRDIEGSASVKWGVQKASIPRTSVSISGLILVRFVGPRMTGYTIGVFVDCIRSALCSIEDGGFDRRRDGRKRLSLSSMPDSQSCKKIS